MKLSCLTHNCSKSPVGCEHIIDVAAGVLSSVGGNVLMLSSFDVSCTSSTSSLIMVGASKFVLMNRECLIVSSESL